jgi:hypothetical protein
MSWASFVRAHAHVIAAADFSATEVWTARGLVRHFTLFVIDVATRHVYIAGTTTISGAQMQREGGVTYSEATPSCLLDAYPLGIFKPP